MARRKRETKREIKLDVRYQSKLVSSLINIVMKSGKKSIAEGIVYDAFSELIEKLGKSDPVDILMGALENTRPKIEVKSRRVGGVTYQVPIQVSFERQQSLALRWIVRAAQSSKGSAMFLSLFKEIKDAYNNCGTAVEKKETMHKNAQANRAFAHLAQY